MTISCLLGKPALLRCSWVQTRDLEKGLQWVVQSMPPTGQSRLITGERGGAPEN